MRPILLIVTLIFCSLARAADLPRVAVVTNSPEPSLAAFADFLSVSLASASQQGDARGSRIRAGIPFS